MYQIMKITIYLLIALMSMGITGCPSDPLTSNEVCSGEPPLFKLYVVSDTDEPFDIEIQSLGIAVRKNSFGVTTQFNPTNGYDGPPYVHKTRVSKKGDIINIPFKPTDIHKNKGCIKDYSVSVDVSSKYRYTSDAPDGRWRKGDLLNPNVAGQRSSVELKCHAPSGQQIKRCFFQVTIGEKVMEEKTWFGLKGEVAKSTYTYKRAIVAPLSGGIGGTSIFNTFANE